MGPWTHAPMAELWPAATGGNLFHSDRGSCIRTKKPNIESYDAFCDRRRLESTALAKEMGLWSHQWARSVTNWSEHVKRAHDSKGWSQHAVFCHDSEWIALRRLLHHKPGRHDTSTYCCKGGPAKRWRYGVVSAQKLVNTKG